MNGTTVVSKPESHKSVRRRAIFLRGYGGPDAFTVETYDPGTPATGEVPVRHTAIGLN